MAAREDQPRRVGTMWTLGQGEPTAEIHPLVEASFRLVGPEATPALSLAMGGTLAASAAIEIQKRLAAGRRCCAAWVAGQIAAYGWISFDEETIGELDLHLRLPPGEAYIWDCATVPAYRQKRLFSALLVFMMAELRAEGVRRVWIGANLENEPSQRGIDRAGFRRVADLLVKQDAPARQMWLEGYPGVPDALVSELQRALLGDLHPIRVK